MPLSLQAPCASGLPLSSAASSSAAAAARAGADAVGGQSCTERLWLEQMPWPMNFLGALLSLDSL